MLQPMVGLLDGHALHLFDAEEISLLCVLMLVRLFRHPLTVLRELRDHRTGAAFLTAVAATSILSSQFFLLVSNRGVAAALWLLALALWVGLIYTFLSP